MQATTTVASRLDIGRESSKLNKHMEDSSAIENMTMAAEQSRDS